MKPVRYDRKQIDKFLKEGAWDKATLFDYWERNAKQWPKKEALVDSLGARLTYEQVVQKVNRIALALVKELKTNKDDRLIVQLPNMVEQFLVRLACARGGLLAISLMSTYREAEVKDIASRTQATSIVIPKEHRRFDYYQMVKELQSDLPCLKHIIITGDDIPEGCISLNEMIVHPYEQEYGLIELESSQIDAVEEVGHLATTTGTTGLPQIIERRLASDIWGAKCHIKNWDLGPNDVVVAIAPTVGAAGDAPAYQAAPIVGAKVALEYLFTGEDTLRFMEKESATVMAVVPAQLARLVELPVERYNLSSLRFIRSTGAYLPPALAQDAEEKFGCPILSTFGSRDTGYICGMPISAPKEKRYTTVGKPLPGVEIKVLDDSGREVKPGEVGTLYFRGPGSTIGYYRDIEKTMTEAFDKDGFASPGDLVTINGDGYLKIMGRKKDIIIRGGQNIYPGEIEDYLIAHPKVVEAALVAMPDPMMGERACAYVTLRGGAQFTFNEMVEYLKTKKIAMYKLPERLEIVEGFPLAGGSKIDKKLLTQWVTDKLKAEGKLT